VSEEKVDQYTKAVFPKYTPAEMAELQQRYSPAQIAALEAGEAAIDPRDLTIQGRLRVDPYRMPYIDDFSTIEPIVDKRPRNHAPPDPNARFMNLDEFTDDLVEWSQAVRVGEPTGQLKKLRDFAPAEFRDRPESAWTANARLVAQDAYKRYMDRIRNTPRDQHPITDADILSYILERSAWTDGNQPSNSALAPGLPNKVPGVAGLYRHAIDPEDGGLDDLGVYQDLKRRTNMTVRQILAVRSKTLSHRLVSNQTRLGKIPKHSVIVVSGNGNGWIGIGTAKSTEFSNAQVKAQQLSIRNMMPIRRYENRTVYGNLEVKISGTVVRLFARPPGTIALFFLSLLSFPFRVPCMILTSFGLCRIRSPRAAPHV